VERGKPHAYSPPPDGGRGATMEVREHGLYIAGKTVPASSKQTAEVLDPATNRPIARVASGTRDVVDAAVEAARLAFESPEWREMDPSQRGRMRRTRGQRVCV